MKNLVIFSEKVENFRRFSEIQNNIIYIILFWISENLRKFSTFSENITKFFISLFFFFSFIQILYKTFHYSYTKLLIPIKSSKNRSHQITRNFSEIIQKFFTNTQNHFSEIIQKLILPNTLNPIQKSSLILYKIINPYQTVKRHTGSNHTNIFYKFFGNFSQIIIRFFTNFEN